MKEHMVTNALNYMIARFEEHIFSYEMNFTMHSFSRNNSPFVILHL